ncbi:MAG: hypothetical protein GXP41_04495 [Chloroflexi bacterium]|nr:hypothetical protein [Chloroflexota bacterium]
MATIWKTQVASLSLVDGQKRDDVPEAGAIEAGEDMPPGSAHKGNLYLLCQLVAPAETWDLISTHIINMAIRTFYGTTGSVTASLRQAVLATNRYLVDENSRSLAGQEILAGITCVALREHDLFIAQGGPSLVYVLHGGELLTYPETAETPQEMSAAQPLGQSPTPSVQLFHCTVNSGDTFLLSASHLPYLAGQDQIEETLQKPSPEDLLQHLETLVGTGDFSALAIRLAEAQITGITSVSAPDGEAPLSPPEPADALPDEIAGTVESSVPQRDTGTAEAPYAGIGEMPEHEDEYEDEDTWDDEPTGPPPGLILARILEVASFSLSYLLRGLAKLVAGIGAVGAVVGSIVGPALEGLGRGIVGVSGYLKRGFLAVGRQMLPGVDTAPSKTRQAQARPQKPQASGSSTRFMLVGLLVPLLIVALAAGFWFRQTQARHVRVQALLQQGQDALRSGPSLPRDSARKTLAKAIQNVEEARRLDPQAEKAGQLLADLAQTLDNVNQVSRLTALVSLDDYTAPPGTEPHRLAFGQDSIFVLDIGLDRVLRYPRTSATGSTQGSTVLQIGQEVGGQTVGELLDIAWVEPGNGRTDAGILVLTKDGHLFEVTKDGQTRQDTIVQTDTWKDVKRIDTFVGNFYALDAGAAQIYKYAPTPEGSYTLPPEAWIQTGQEATGPLVDMAIDGNIFLLTADGIVSKFTAGEKQDFPMSDLEKPMTSTKSIFADPDGRFVYVGDPTEQRIVVFDKEGQFVRQLRTKDGEGTTEPLGNLVSVAVDEAQQQVFLLTPKHLWKATMPDFGS